MIVLRAVRVEDSGAETELGEVRLTETGAGVYSHLSTTEGGPVIAHVVERMRAIVPSRGGRVSFPPSRGGRVQ